MVENPTEVKKATAYPFNARPDRAETDQKEVQALFDAKRTKNIAAGQKAYLTADYKPFTGFGREGMNKLFVIEVELDKASRQEIQKRVIQPMQKIAESLGISEIYFAGGKDQDTHVTLHVGRFDNFTPEQQEQARKWLAEGSEEEGRHKGQHMSHLRQASDILTGLEFQIDTVVCSGRDTYICAGKAEGNQGAAYRVRRIFDKALERAQKKFSTTEGAKIGPHYPRYDDIFHISAARFTGIVEPDKLQSFAQRVNETIGTDLVERPINVRAESVNPIIATKGVEKRKPELLT